MKANLSYFFSALGLFNSLYLWAILQPGRRLSLDLLMILLCLAAFSLPFWAGIWRGGLASVVLLGTLLVLGFQNENLGKKFSFPLLDVFLSPSAENPRLATALLAKDVKGAFFSPIELSFEVYNLHVSESEEVEAWRETKAPQHLRNAGYGLLIFPETWLGHTSEAEYETLQNPRHYRLIAEYPYGGERYFIYEILGSS